MQKNSQINIRFDAQTEDALNETAQALGVSKSALVRSLTEKFLAEVKRTGAVQLKPKWIEDLVRADARSEWGDRRVVLNEDTPEYKATKKEPKQ